MSSSPAYSLSKPTRFHGLDAARAFAMLMGVVFHAAMAYKTRGGWMSGEHARSLGLDFFCSLTHGFRMPLFFLMAGFFAQMTFQRDGVFRFLKKRLLRIGFPFLVSCYTLVPLCHFLARYIETGILQSPFAEWTWRDAVGLGNVYHLWFLRYLLLFYVGAIILWLFIRLIPLRSRTELDRGFARLIQAWWGPLLLAMPSLIPTGIEHFIAQTPLQSQISGDFWIDVSFFLAGWLLYRQRGLIDTLIKRRASNFVGTVFMTLSGWVLAFGIARSPHINSLLAVSKVFYAWYSTFFLIGIFSKYCNFHNSQVQYNVDSAYWVYLIHLPIVFAMQIALVNTGLNAWIKFSIVSTVTMAACLLTYRLFVRGTFIDAVLTGRASHRPTELSTPKQAIQC